MTTYFAHLSPSPDGGYVITFPDLPGCTCHADSPARVSAQAEEELPRYLAALMAAGFPLPDPSTENQLTDPTPGKAAELMAFDVDLSLLNPHHAFHYHTL